jgi:hypothetical protein
VRLAPIRWLVHVSGTKKGDPTDTKYMRSIEMEVVGSTKDEATQAATTKAEQLGYVTWGVRAAPLRNDNGATSAVILPPVVNAAALPALPAPVPEDVPDTSFDRLFSDTSVFYPAIPIPKYGRSITSDSCP